MSLFIQRRSVPFWMPHKRVWVAARADFVVANDLEKTAASNPIQRFNEFHVAWHS